MSKNKAIKFEIGPDDSSTRKSIWMNGTKVGEVVVRNGEVKSVNAEYLPDALRSLLEPENSGNEYLVDLSPDEWCREAEDIFEEHFREMANFQTLMDLDYAALYMENTGKRDSYGHE